MGVITANTFDPLRRYVGVRLQNGVPLVDADWNELDDLHKFEVQAFLKWFVGNGVPEGNDGFRIDGTGMNNDFFIRSGVSGAANGLSNVGRCLVNGLDVIITADTKFSDQPLHESKNPSAILLATTSGGGVVKALTPLAANGIVLVYLDVWERLVTASDDQTLVLPGLGTESCARIKRESVVRVRSGTSVPKPNDSDYAAGHNYYALATITRRATDPQVNPGDVTDLRERRLLLPPASLITDVLGMSPTDYRQGLNRPAISLREAINALLRGELPSTPDTAIAPDPGLDVIKRAFLFDSTNGLVAIWYSDRFGSTDQVVATRLDLNNVATGFVAPVQQVTTGVAHSDPHAALLPNGDLLVAYQKEGAAADIFYKRATLAGLNAATEQPVATTANVAETSPFVVVTGDLVTFFYHLASATNPGWQYRRFQHTTNAFLDGTTQPLLQNVSITVRDLHGAPQRDGNIWIAFPFNNNLSVNRFTPSSANLFNLGNGFTAGQGVNDQPFVLCRANGDVRVFWRESTTGLYSATFSGGTLQSPASIIPNTVAGDRQPCAVEDANGAIWLFWTRGAVGSGDIFLMRNDPISNSWGQPRQMTFSSGDDTAPFALVAPNNAIWTFWSTTRDGNLNLYYKRLVTAL